MHYIRRIQNKSYSLLLASSRLYKNCFHFILDVFLNHYFAHTFACIIYHCHCTEFSYFLGNECWINGGPNRHIKECFPLLMQVLYTKVLANIQLELLSVITVDAMYEIEGKRTYLAMLIQVGIYLPLLVGLFLLYPWLAGNRKIKYSQQNDETEEGNKETDKLILSSKSK